MKPAPFELRRPTTLDEALDLLAALGSDAQVLAGGQSLLPLLLYRMVSPHVLLDINRIEALGQIGWHQGLRIGAVVRHSQLGAVHSEQHPAVAALLAAHARQIAFPAVRNRGTAVGSIVQADPKGDWPLLFCALGAQVELVSKRGTRRMAVHDFILGPLHTARAVDELAVALTLDTVDIQLHRWGRAKLMHRAGEYAMCSAIVVQRADGWRCWLGAHGERPVALPTLAESLQTSTRMPREQWMDLARQDIAAAWPELGPLDAHRHAVNAIDALQQALAPQS